MVPPSSFGVPYHPTPEAMEALQRAQRGLGVFDRQRRLLERQLGGTEREVLAGIRQQELPYRDAIIAVVGRVLPPEVRVHLPELLELFNSLDESLYLQPARSPERAFPVEDLSDNGRLRPVVTRLHIRSSGGYEPEVRSFRDRLTEALRAQTYAAPVTP